jgi:hypothetical protein
MWATLALSASLWAATGGAVVLVEPRLTVPILLLTPPGFDARVRGSDVFEAAALVLERTVGMQGLSPEQAGLSMEALDRCSVSDRFTCAVRLIHALPVAVRTSGWALLVLLRPSSGGVDRLDLQLLDIDGAARALSTTQGDTAEDAVFRHARALPPVTSGPADDARTLAAALERAAGDALVELLPRASLGALTLDVACAPCDVAWNGRWLATLTTTTTLLTQIPSGEHHLTLSKSGEARDYTVLIEVDHTLPLDARDFAAPHRGEVPRVLLAAGGAAALVGGAILVSVARAGAPDAVCLPPAGTSCGSLRPWAHLDPDALDATATWSPTFLAGTALAGAGLSWGAAAALDAELSPVWATLLAAAGLGVGVGVGLLGSAP